MCGNDPPSPERVRMLLRWIERDVERLASNEVAHDSAVSKLEAHVAELRQVLEYQIFEESGESALSDPVFRKELIGLVGKAAWKLIESWIAQIWQESRLNGLMIYRDAGHRTSRNASAASWSRWNVTEGPGGSSRRRSELRFAA